MFPPVSTVPTGPGAAAVPLELHEDRCFDPDPAIRRVARALYEETRPLPLICPHGHVEASLLAENRPFPEPAALIITPDHYIFRLLYSQGISLEALGIPTRSGAVGKRDPRRIWRLFAAHYFKFRGTPTGAWLDYELYHVFGVRVQLNADTAEHVYEHISERLASPEYLPRALFERFRIEVLTTTDAAADGLEHHRALRASGWQGTVLPCFRPDALFRIARPEWLRELARLEAVCGSPIRDYGAFGAALVARREYFRGLGATSTDHGVEEPRTERLPDEEADALLQRAIRGEASAADQQRFEAHMLMEMARLSVADGLVMQLHAGALRDHNEPIRERYGPDKGADIPVATEYTRNLRPLLNAYGNDPRFRLVLFTLDEATYARELAPLAGHYPALRLGPAWWFNDSIEGMRRFRQRTTETASIYNTAGQPVGDHPPRQVVAHHVIDLEDARPMARALAYELAKETYRLPAGDRPLQSGGGT
ncbi:MAG: glucuronate isomerase [Gemmatimonadetes bacterium]|nr:glucuronate isomerase [Gemmatimonadota bacterium]